MNRYCELICIPAISFVLLFATQDVLSQTGREITEIHTDTSASGASRHSLFAGAGYGSNMIYLGSTISQDQPFGYAALTYGYRDALYLTFSAVHLSGRSPFIAFHAGSLNYTHTFNSWFDVSAGLSRYKAANSLADTLFSKFTYSDLTLGFDWRILYTRITAGVLFFDETNAYIQIRNSRYFETPGFTKKNLTVSFDPNFSVLFGPLTKIETTEGRIIKLSPPYRKGVKYITVPTENISTSFGLMELDISLPVSLNSSRFTVEAEPSYVLPAFEDMDYPGLKGFVFLLSGYFRIM